MNRRVLVRVLVVALLAALAGCSAAGSLSMEPVDSDEELASLASVEPDDVGYPSDNPEPIVVGAIENTTATVNATEPPVDIGTPVSYGESYYTLSRQQTGERTEQEFVLELENATSITGPTVQFEELPEIDKRAIRVMVDQIRSQDGDEENPDTFYPWEELNQSVLAGPQQYDGVVYQGETYALGVAERRSVTVYRYEYTATEIAASASEYADLLRQEASFELDSLSGDQSDIVDEAANGTYNADSTDDNAFDTLVDQFLAHEAVKDERDRAKWLVEHDGQLYLATLSFSQFAEEDDVETLSIGE
jgi:predicted small lipoprotein YifL